MKKTLKNLCRQDPLSTDTNKTDSKSTSVEPRHRVLESIVCNYPGAHVAGRRDSRLEPGDDYHDVRGFSSFIANSCVFTNNLYYY